MASDQLQMLTAIDPARLTEIVRVALDNPSFQVGSWNVRHLSDLGGVNPEGLFLFEGDGHDEREPRQWSIVLKTIRANRPEPGPDHLFHWRREYMAMQSGMLLSMPGPLTAPRCFGLEAQPDGAWLWMEHIVDRTPRRWGTVEYAFAANQLGRTTGAWLARRSMPDEPWLCRAHALVWAEMFPPNQEQWANPFVRTAWPDSLRERVMALWTARARLGAALARLPQTFAHFDSQRRNLMIRPDPDGQDELVAVDWAWCGLGPVGADAAILLGNSLLLFEGDASTAPALDQAIFPAYLEGLRAADWTGDADTVRLAYSASIALFCAFAALTWTTSFVSSADPDWIKRQSGMDAASCAQHYVDLAMFAVDQGDEALRLMEAMGR